MAALILTVRLEQEAIIVLVYLNDGKVRIADTRLPTRMAHMPANLSINLLA